jgi:hypothetical protein
MFTNRLSMGLIAVFLFMCGCVSSATQAKRTGEMLNTLVKEEAELKNLRLSKITPIEKPLATRALVIVPSDYWNIMDEEVEVLRRRQIFGGLMMEISNDPENMSLPGYDITIFLKKEEPTGPWYIRGSAADEAEEVKINLRESPPEMTQPLSFSGPFSESSNFFKAQTMIRNRSEYLSKLYVAWLDEVAKMTTKHLGATRLMFASEMGHLNVVQLLVDEGADINAKSNNGLTALMIASGIGHREIVQLLIAEGADVNAKKDNGETALMLASQKGHREIVQLLIAEGAKFDDQITSGGGEGFPPQFPSLTLPNFPQPNF